MATLNTRLTALEERQGAASAGSGVLIYPSGLSDEALETWVAERAAALPPGQALLLLPDNGRSWKE